jgi:hypothetical protein
MRKFRDLTGVDPHTLSCLSAETRQLVWNELLTPHAEVNIQFKIDPYNQLMEFSKSPDWKMPDYNGILDRLVSEIKPVGFSNIINRKNTIGFGLVTNSSSAPVKKVNDRIHSGLYVTFNGKIQIQEYCLRLICSNGMLGMDLKSAHTLTEQNFAGTISSIQTQTNLMIERFTHLDEQPLVNPGGIVGRLSQLRILSSRQVAQVTEELSSLGGEATEFDLVNLITSFQHERENNISWLLAGGRATEVLHGHKCSHCGA